MLLVTQNSAKPFNIYFGTSGLTVTATLSKNGGSFNAVSPTSITDRGNGYYSITPLAAHRDTIGENAWLFSASGQSSLPRVEQVGLLNVDVVAVGANTVSRNVTDTTPILFTWPVAAATITVTRSIDAGSYGAATASPAVFEYTQDGQHFYSLAYSANDRPAGAGSVVYRLDDGTVVRLLPLQVEVGGGATAEDIAAATKESLFDSNSQNLKISLSAGGNSYTPDSVIVDVRSIADQVISEDGAVKFKLFFGDDETYGAAKRLVDMTAGTFDEATFKAQAFIDSGLATNVKIVEEANRVIDEIPETGLGGI
jgi:hypothetical protein